MRGIPLVFNMCVRVRGFLSTACFLSHISGMEGQSYYTTEGCLHSAAASMVRLNRPAYSLDGPAPKAGLWFMGQFSLDSSDIISGFDGKLKTQFGFFFFCNIFLSKGKAQDWKNSVSSSTCQQQSGAAQMTAHLLIIRPNLPAIRGQSSKPGSGVAK